MPKLGMRPIRRKQLIDAAIAAIHEFGLADATVARIARKAGVSAGIVHHYFADKDDLLFATMRHLLEDLRRQVVVNLRRAASPRERLHAIVEASFADHQFSEAVMAAWLGLYGNARQSDRLARIVRLYHSRLRANLVHALRDAVARDRVESVAEGIASMIDGLWLRCALRGGTDDARDARLLTLDYVDAQLRAGAHRLN
ncbi:MAG TPA: transcriptional regulator BetI [Aestuariivirgaceae bacterium]|nr:transcriptional regulator BetI [Aestuariivirgaceae bacterium]